MCNRYRMTLNERELAGKFGIEVESDRGRLPPPELFPKRPAWVVRQQDGARILDVMDWGVPLAIRNPKTGATSTKPVTNVRNLTSPFWKSTIAKLDFRCLVPVTSFCEWEGETGSKQDRWFSLPASPVFAFAGVWRPGPKGDRYAFLTCEPNPLVATIHPKAMPVILHPDDYDRWLSDKYVTACELAQPFPSQLMTVA